MGLFFENDVSAFFPLRISSLCKSLKLTVPFFCYSETTTESLKSHVENFDVELRLGTKFPRDEYGTVVGYHKSGWIGCTRSSGP